MGQDNTIYTFSIDISLSSKGQNKSKLQKQRSNVLISIVTCKYVFSLCLLQNSLQHQMLQVAAISILSTMCQVINSSSDVNSWHVIAKCICDYVITIKLDTSFTKRAATE